MKRTVHLRAEYYTQSNYQGSVYTWDMDWGDRLLMSLPDILWETKTKRELDREAARASGFYAAQRERDEAEAEDEDEDDQ